MNMSASVVMRLPFLLSPRKDGQFVGFSKNVGNALTCTILADDTNKLIHRSEVCSAEDSSSSNLRSDNWGDTNPESTESREIIKSWNDREEKPPMALLDVDKLIGEMFNVTMEDSMTQEMTLWKQSRHMMAGPRTMGEKVCAGNMLQS